MRLAIFLILLGLVLGIFAISPTLVFSPTFYQVSAYESLQTLKEDFGQMLIIGFDGTRITPELSKLIEDIRPGGVLLLGRNIENKAQLKKLIEDLQRISFQNTGLPLFIAVDQEGKALARIPWAKTPADLKELGVNMNLAPVLDSRNQGDYIYERSFKKSNALILAKTFLEEHIKEGVLTVPKHFPGYDGVTFNPEEGIIPRVSHIPETSLFKNLDMRLVMVSHVIYDSLDSKSPFPLSTAGIGFLKKELGEEMLIMSDDLSSKSLMRKYYFSRIGRDAIKSGINILLVGGYPDAAVVAQFFQAMENELSLDVYLAGVSKLYQLLYGEVEKDSELQFRIKESAEKIRKIKKQLL